MRFTCLSAGGHESLGPQLWSNHLKFTPRVSLMRLVDHQWSWLTWWLHITHFPRTPMNFTLIPTRATHVHKRTPTTHSPEGHLSTTHSPRKTPISPFFQKDTTPHLTVASHLAVSRPSTSTNALALGGARSTLAFAAASLRGLDELLRWPVWFPVSMGRSFVTTTYEPSPLVSFNRAP